MLSEKLQREIANFELSGQRKDNYSSKQMAWETLQLLLNCVEESQKEDDIEKNLVYLTKRIQSAVPNDLVVSNFCIRVIDLLNAELNKSLPIFNSSFSHDVRRSQSLLELFVASGPQKIKREILSQHLKEKSTEKEGNTMKNRMEKGIQKLMTKVPHMNVKQDFFHSFKVSFYIHDCDVLLTIGRSSTIATFFISAAKYHKFSVIVAEHAPSYDGIQMANILRENKIDCIVIPDSAIFAIMPRVTTVFCPCRAIFADGTLVTMSYVKSVYLAAKHHSKPFVVVYWKCKLTDRFVRPKDSFTVLTSPNDIIPLDDVCAKNITIINPDGECFSCQSVALFINEKGPHGSDDIFNLVNQIYQKED